MWDYEIWKEKWDKNKTPIVIGVCFVLVFFLGFGVGSYDRESRQVKRFQTNYTTKPKGEPIVGGTAPKPEIFGVNTTTPADAKCAVKGNISAKGKKIFHILGGAFYEKTKAEQCFATEGEARSAGFSKSSR